MTACKDVQDVNLGKKAVSAALAGTLAVGMVPAVALAAPADDAAADDGIETLALSAKDDFEAGKVTGVTYNGKALTFEKGVATMDVLEKDATTGFAVTQVTTSQGNVVNLASGDVELKYSVKDPSAAGFAPSADWTSTIIDPTKPGTYWIQATVNKLGDTNPNYAYSDAVIVVKVVVEPASLEGAFAYEPGKTSDDFSDKTFVYTGTNADVKFALGTKSLDGLVEVVWYEGMGSGATPMVDDAGDPITDAPTNAGTYTAVLEGLDDGQYDGQKVAVVVTIDKLDLSTANIVINDIQPNGTFAISSINNVTGADLTTLTGASAGNITVKIDKGPGQNLPGTAVAGPYNLIVEAGPAGDKANTNVVGTKSVVANVVASNAVTWAYSGSGFDVSNAAGVGTLTSENEPINLAADNPTFDPTKLTVSPTANTDEKLAYTLTVTDAKGNVVPNSSLSTPGTWNVTAKIDVANAENDYQYGGTFSGTVTVKAGAIDGDTDIIVKQNGVVTGAPKFVYDGSNVLPKLSVEVKAGKKVLTEGSDYTLKITNKDDGEVVTEAVNAGVYTVEVVAPNYTITNDADFDVTVNAIEVKALRFAGLSKDKTGSFIPYTGKATTPVVEYSADATSATDDDATWATLPADAYTLSFTFTPAADSDAKAGTVAEFKAKGAYAPSIASTTKGVGVNYTLGTATLGAVDVRDGELVFKDVPSTAWYYESVNKAFDNGYMTGYNGSALFGPNDDITRAQVACVLYKMAGAPTDDRTEDSFNSQQGYVTGFSDVDGHMWYAKAIAWAKNAKVISGYGDGTFGPNDMITRQQFAAMLANYARAMGQSTTVEDVDAVLATKKDGGQVASWAKDSVAWAVSKQIMGNGGSINPKSDITRAEVAAMAVNFQPEQIDTPTK